MRGRIRRSAQAGFSYLEVLVGVMILAIVAGAVVQGFAASSAQVGRAKVDTVAAEIAQARLEEARQLAYGDVGTVGGNPEGTLQPSMTKTVGGTAYLVSTAVSYVDDPALGRPRTYVNYKRITVTVLPQVPNARPVVQSTISAPPNFGAISGKATAVLTVIDALTGDPIPGVAVTLSGSTSPTRTDSTGADGKVVFAGLEPSDPVVTSPKHWYQASAALSGYATHPDSTPNQVRQSLAASQTWQATIKMFKPARIRVNLRNSATGALIGERAEVKVNAPPPSSASQTFVGFTGAFDITTLNGAQIQPSATAFTVAASADCFTSASRTSPVPVGYPTNTTQVFDFDLDPLPDVGYLDVWVVNNANNQPISTAEVQVSGGEVGLVPRLRGVDGNGYARYCLQKSGATRYVVSAAAPGFGAGSVVAEVKPGQTTPLTLRLVQSATGDIRLTSGVAGALVRVQALIGTYDASQSTNSFGYADFTGLATGTYLVYKSTGFSGDTPVWSVGVPLVVAGGVRIGYTFP